MNSSKIIELINQIEETYPVDTWVVDDIHVWPIIRIKLFNDLCFFYNFKQPTNKKGFNVFYYLKTIYKVIKSLLTVVIVYLVDYKNNAKMHETVDAVFLAQEGTYIKVKDFWYDRICDPVIESLFRVNKKWFILFQGIKDIHPRHNKSKLIEPYLILYGMLLPRLTMLMNKKPQHKLEQYNDVVSFLKTKGCSHNLITVSELEKQVLQIKLLSKFYKNILRVLNPKVSFVVAYYGPSGYSFNLACRELGIVSIDIQHGVQGEFHRSYGRWNKVPSNGYELLPNRFFCWTDEDANIINKWASKTCNNHKAISTGNWFLQKWVDGTGIFVDYYDTFINKQKERHHCNGLVNILYTMNGFEDDQTIENLLNITKSTSGFCFWWIRCHPCFLNRKKDIDKILNVKDIRNVETDICSDVPLYAILRHVDLHITESSSVVIEAEQFGVPSIVTSKYGLELYPEYRYAKGFVNYCSLDADILNVINRVVDISKKNVSRDNIDNSKIESILKSIF